MLGLLWMLCSGVAGAQTFAVDPGETDIRILIYRGGLLGGLGHNHVISVDKISGTLVLADNPAESSVELRFAVANLVVDDPALRAAEGADFPPGITEKDILGTRENMLSPKLLDAENYAEVRIVSSEISGDMPDLRVAARVAVKKTANLLTFPVTLERDHETLTATGELVMSHVELGLRPFRAGLGTLRVRDEIRLKYRIVANEAGQ